jgi:glycosyltransferase involved in cell wall biosynthesis
VRIAWVVTGGFDRSGRERVVPILVTTVERLASRHDVHVFVLRYAAARESYPLAGATVHDLGSPAGLFRQHRALVRALRASGPFDLLHAFWAMPAGMVATVAGVRLRTPVIVTLSTGELVSIPSIEYGLQRRRATRLAVRLTTRLASRMIVATEYMARLARQLGVEAVRVPLGVDVRAFSPGAPIPAGPPWRLLNVGSLNRVKDRPTLLNAVRKLADQGVDVHLDIVGEDILGGRTQALASDLGIAERVTFHGAQSNDALPAYYRAAHLFVQSSRHEAAGVAVLEAAACGLPIVGTSVGYVADWAPDRAIAVPVGDPAALAGAIGDALKDPRRRAQLAAAARAWAVAHDADWTLRELERHYEQVRKSREPERRAVP